MVNGIAGQFSLCRISQVIGVKRECWKPAIRFQIEEIVRVIRESKWLEHIRKKGGIGNPGQRVKEVGLSVVGNHIRVCLRDRPRRNAIQFRSELGNLRRSLTQRLSGGCGAKRQKKKSISEESSSHIALKRKPL